MKALIHSGYIRDGRQVHGKVIEIDKEELSMLDGLGIKYEVLKEVKEVKEVKDSKKSKSKDLKDSKDSNDSNNLNDND